MFLHSMKFKYLGKKLFCSKNQNLEDSGNIFGEFLSRKHGQKCCTYNQNGKPLSKEIIDKFLNGFLESSKMELINNPKLKNLTEYEKELYLLNWQVSKNYTELIRIFYFKNVFLLTDFIKELYELDLSSNIMQIPGIEVKYQDVFKITLYTPRLKGLSYKDLQLAGLINTLNFKKYMLIPLSSEEHFRKEIRRFNIEEQNKSIYEELLKKGEKRTTLENKYDDVIYQQINKNNKL